MTADVFISYRRTDTDFVKQLYQELNDRGIPAWFDRENIEVADHWRSSIAEGIRNCKVFLLVLSPDAVQSINIRKEVDLAEQNNKKIVPLIWRQTEIPVMFDYALAGIQWIEFNEEPSQAKFDELAAVINKLLGISALSELTTEPELSAATEQPPATSRRGRGRGRGDTAPRRGRGTAQEVSAVAVGIGVITKVVTQISRFTADEQDAINKELKWLFNAADHFLKIRRGELGRSEPVPVSIPEEAELTADGANNVIMSNLDDFSLQMIDGQIQSIIKQINIYMRNLAIELDKQAQMGGTAASNLALINSIKLQQKSIAERTQELAKLMEQVYGIMVYGPEDIVKQLL